jgi:hypothetical protein
LQHALTDGKRGARHILGGAIALNIPPAGLTKETEMQSAISSFLRVFIAIAIGFASAVTMPARECGAAVADAACRCCKNAGAPSCCRAPENESPSQQPAESSLRDSLAMQPLGLHARTAAVVLPSAAIVIFPRGKNVCCAEFAGHSFQSVRCMRMV